MDISSLFYTSEIDQLAKTIAKELDNRNFATVYDYPRSVFSNKDLGDTFTKNCKTMHAQLLSIISKDGMLDLLNNTAEKPDWLRYSLGFGGIEDGNQDIERISLGIGVTLIERQKTKFDEHIKHLNDSRLVEKLGLHITDTNNLLVSLSDKRLELRNHGLILNGNVLIYPHQFLRRFYSANFVGIPHLLNKAKTMGAEVSIRIDPLRKTIPKYYREIVEADYWGGIQFSKKLLQDKYLTGSTLHGSRGLTSLVYHADFTIFRTKMMDKNQREFMIEEYCPLEQPFWSSAEKSPGVGEKYSIQKFAHFVYDQQKNCFTHLDGAVRVFTIKEYGGYFETVKAKINSGEKIGKRHKLFLVEGIISEELAQELLTEWFRYNPHITEYFTGTTIEPSITYEQLESLRNRN